MSHRIWCCSLAIVGIGLGLQAAIGCTGVSLREADRGDSPLRAALEERDAAAQMVAKAIERYCWLRTDTLEAKQRCVIGQHVDLQFIGRVGAASISDEFRMTGAAGQPIVTGQLLQCEVNGRSTTCRRKLPAFAELWGAPLRDADAARPRRSPSQ
ncbi:MAG: hypothetical protein M3Z35_08805 [Nitrospirota bacterium]|nr:hypothetical protein [Nitrospirota bacterium]